MYGFTTTFTTPSVKAISRTAVLAYLRAGNVQRRGRCHYAAFAFANSSNAAMALAAYISDGPPPM